MTLFRRFWREYLRRYLPALVAAMLLTSVEGAAVGALAYMLQPMFDTVFLGGRLDLIPWIGAAIFGLFAARGLASIAQKIILARVATDATIRVQRDLLAHVMRLDSAFFAVRSPGVMIERVQGDVSAIQRIWISLVTNVSRDAVGLIALLVVALQVDPVWTLVAGIGAPLLILPAAVVQRYVRRKAHLLRDIAGRRTTRLDEIFHGIAPIKLNAMEDYQTARFEQTSTQYQRATIRQQVGSATVPALVDIAIGIGFFAVILYGGPEIVAGEKTIGEFMSFFTAMSLAFQPLRRLAGMATQWQVMRASLERIYGLRDTVPTIVSPATPPAERPASTDVAFEGVHLRYGDAPVLRGIGFAVPEGTTTALVGPSGAGKTTVFNVLARLVEPDAGEVRVGGHRLRDYDLATLRGLFAVVGQDAPLFDDTVRENVTLGHDVSEEALRRALGAAHVDQFLPTLPKGLDTPVGARGSNLSGGQRQRVAIARAVLRDAPVLLLDEATSALDTESERLVQAALDRLSAGRTTMVIAHRLSTVRDADQILVMDAGRIVERGRHDDLVASDGLYARLAATQFGERSAREASAS